MAGVGRFVAEASAGENRAERGAVFAHDCILCGRGVCFEKLTVVKVICVLHISCRVMLRNVQRFKAVIIVDYFKIVFDREAHRKEYFLKLTLYKRDGMIRTGFLVTRKRVVV